MFLWTVSKRLIFTAALVAVTLIGADLATAASLSLSWKDTSSSESGFKVERLIGTTYAQIATVSANIASYIDSGLTAGSTYCYRIRAFNSAGTSSPSNLSCATALATSSTTGIPTGSGNPVPTTQLGSKWTDYRLSLKIRSNDNDLIGVMFRYRDNDNYYRFWWSAQGKSRRLEKKVAGVVHVLAEQSGSPEIAYKAGQTYFLETVAQGSSLKVKINGVQIFAVTDTSFAEGTVALYSHYNTGSVFDDVVVEDLFTNDLLLSDNFNDGDFTGWTILDEGPLDGPSSWSAAGGALIQSSNIGSVDYSRRPGTYALYTKGSWKDYRFTLKMKSADNDLLGVMFRYQDNENYYRLSWGEQIAGRRLVKREKGLFTVIAEDAVPYS
ncbi:MAG: family 16 glycoside hydrolase, partial [Candidatus Binatia bacterium]